MYDLDSVFQSHQEVESLFLVHGVHADVVVQISQLSGSEDLRSVHLQKMTIDCSPLMRSCRLEHKHHCINPRFVTTVYKDNSKLGRIILDECGVR